MREIKFRAWDGDRMQKVLTLGLNEGFISTNKMSSDIEDFVIMQFTGFLDQSGVEVYEGDILKCQLPVEIIDNGCHSIDGETVLAEVIFEDGAFMARGKTVLYPWVLDGDTTFLSWLLDIKAYDKYKTSIEVVGNIHENEELLKEVIT